MVPQNMLTPPGKHCNVYDKSPSQAMSCDELPADTAASDDLPEDVDISNEDTGMCVHMRHVFEICLD